MRTTRPAILRIPGTLLLSLLCPWLVHGQSMTQTLVLQPGWNAVWLEVEPPDNSASAVFSGLPVSSVWTLAERSSSVDFIQSPSEETFNESGWLGWFPSSGPESFLNNLFSVHANQAYLIKSTNATSTVWNLTGRPSLGRPIWVPDSFNLRGAAVDPLEPPTFLNYFRHSPAHYDAAAGQLRQIYRLNSATGQWQTVAPGDTVQSGVAYWIYTDGASEYLAPLRARVDLGDGLDFGNELSESILRFENLTATPFNALVRDITGSTNGGLSHYQFDPSVGGQWAALPDPLALAVLPGTESRLRLAPRRRDIVNGAYAAVLEIRNGAGTRLAVPVVARTQAAPEAGAPPPPGNPLAGLWVGSATLNAVSEPHSTDPDTPTPTRSPFNLRLIIHLDTLGQARLLKEVVQMWRDGSFTNGPGGNLEVDKPGRYVLITEDSLIPMFSGATVRDGEPVGRRLSTIGYDFAPNGSNNYVNLSGLFAIGQSLTGTLLLPADHPTNPYLHRFHPDHDNLNSRFDGPLIEAFQPTRQIHLAFAASPPSGPAVPDFGYNEMGGAYSETITGIHKRAIQVSGTFRLTRVSSIPDLNPSPTP